MTASDESPLDRTAVFFAGSLPTSRAEMGHYLLVLEGSQPGLRVEIAARSLVIGRGSECDLVLPDGRVSRRHCTIELHCDTPVLIDHDSTNGTLVGGFRINQPFELTEGVVFSVGAHVLQYELRNRQETRESLDLDKALTKASSYVQALLPTPLGDGPIRTDWLYLPSERLGGDVFGYHALDDDNFAAYIVDVAGHGVSAAMHSVSLLNVLRQRALPDTDFTDPEQVLRKLNRMFQMDQHDDMYFTMWYGVYNRPARALRFASGGHHPGFLVTPDRMQATPVQSRGPLIGLMPDHAYKAEVLSVTPGATLYLFSDGVFEIVTATGKEWGLDDFLPLLTQAADPMATEPERLHRQVRAIARPGPFDDDFSLLTVTFAS
ncbi:MAG: SpoIIE family protein phosphatase [Porticoccaceae bacterium]